VRRVVGELVQSREETNKLRNKVVELEEAVGKTSAGDGGELKKLRKDNRELRVKIELIESKAKEVLKKLDVVKQG
jgi:hypothetical protein